MGLIGSSCIRRFGSNEMNVQLKIAQGKPALEIALMDGRAGATDPKLSGKRLADATVAPAKRVCRMPSLRESSGHSISKAELSKMSVKELKWKATLHAVDVAGCVEKEDLIDA